MKAETSYTLWKCVGLLTQSLETNLADASWELSERILYVLHHLYGGKLHYSCFHYCHNQFYTNISSTDEPDHFSPEVSGLGKFGSDKAEQGSEEMWEQHRQSSKMGRQLSLVLSEWLGLTVPRTTSSKGLWVTTSCNPWWKLDRSKPYLDPLDSSRH